MNVKIDYRKGILFVRLEGVFNRITYKRFNEEVFPIILKNELKYVVINFEKLKRIDKCGIDSLNDLFSLMKRYEGKVTFCNLNNLEIKEFLEENLLMLNYFESKDELSSLGLFEL